LPCTVAPTLEVFLASELLSFSISVCRAAAASFAAAMAAAELAAALVCRSRAVACILACCLEASSRADCSWPMARLRKLLNDDEATLVASLVAAPSELLMLAKEGRSAVGGGGGDGGALPNPCDMPPLPNFSAMRCLDASSGDRAHSARSKAGSSGAVSPPPSALALSHGR
jgi:hypothetical protein